VDIDYQFITTDRRQVLYIQKTLKDKKWGK